MFLGKTIENILENIEAKTEIIAVCDGYETEIPPIPDDPRVKIIKLPKSVGQRAATNIACKESQAKYVPHWNKILVISKPWIFKINRTKDFQASY
jgi:hypothetical protein